MSEVIINEKWNPVEGFESIYEVSNFGRIRSKWKKDGIKLSVGMESRVIGGSRHRLGYVMVHLRSPDGKKKQEWLHRLVAKEFCKAEKGKNEVRHLDGNPRNNSADNLAWATHAENQADIVVHKSCRFGDSAPRTKLTNKQAIAIVSLYRIGGFTHKYLAMQFGVSPVTIRRIVCGIKWSMITGLEKRKE